MPNPQSPEARRSATTASQSPDSISSQREADRPIGSSGPAGPVPEDNRPGHHPGHEQDRPDLDAFAAKLGVPATDDPDDLVPAGAGLREPAGGRPAQLWPAEILAERGGAVLRSTMRSGGRLLAATGRLMTSLGRRLEDRAGSA